MKLCKTIIIDNFKPSLFKLMKDLKRFIVADSIPILLSSSNKIQNLVPLLFSINF